MTDKKRFDNDEAVAYGFFMLIAFMVILAPILYVVLGMVVNSVLDPANGYVDGGKMSQQSAEAMGWQVLAISLTPLITLAGGFLWSVNQGVVTRNGGPSTFPFLTSGWIIMVIFLMSGFMLSFFTSVYFDQVILPEVDDLYDNYEVTSDWANEDGSNFLINFAYFVLYLIPVGGWVIYLQSILKRTSGDRYQ